MFSTLDLSSRGVNGFRDKIGGSELMTFKQHQVKRRGYHGHRHVVVLVPDIFENFNSLNTRELVVKKHYIRTVVVDNLYSVLTCGGLCHFKVKILIYERIANAELFRIRATPSYSGFIINDKDL